jgi:hypothetical protein
MGGRTPRADAVAGSVVQRNAAAPAGAHPGMRRTKRQDVQFLIHGFSPGYTCESA